MPRIFFRDPCSELQIMIVLKTIVFIKQSVYVSEQHYST